MLVGSSTADRAGFTTQGSSGWLLVGVHEPLPGDFSSTGMTSILQSAKHVNHAQSFCKVCEVLAPAACCPRPLLMRPPRECPTEAAVCRPHTSCPPA